jgi:DNA-binding response OmpR family regulator
LEPPGGVSVGVLAGGDVVRDHGGRVVSILLAGDEAAGRSSVAKALRAEGFVVTEAADLASTRQALRTDPPDVVVLDVVLPDGSGLDLLRNLIASGGPPVILATSRSAEVDRVLGLELGAEDCVVKPFSIRELAARVRRSLRRPPQPDRLLEFGELTIDLAGREVRLAGRRVDLTGREFDLLAYLASTPRRVCSREEILREVWCSSSRWQSSKTVTEHVRRVRSKIRAGSGGWITTVSGVGYRFDPTADERPGRRR